MIHTGTIFTVWHTSTGTIVAFLFIFYKVPEMAFSNKEKNYKFPNCCKKTIEENKKTNKF